MVDLKDYISPIVNAGQVAGRPVGVKHSNAPGGIFQLQKDGTNSRRIFQVKGAWNSPPPQSDWEELWYDDAYIWRGIDTSRIPAQGGPYTLYDVKGQRGSKWAKRFMAVGDPPFERNPFVAAFDLQTGNHTRVDGPVKSWLKLAKHHDVWRGIPDVIELWWLVNSPNDAKPYEAYFYGKGVGLIGFEHAAQQTYPDALFSGLPPATGIPVLVRKIIGFSLPALPDVATIPAGGFWLLYPIDGDAWRNQGLDAARPYGPHEGVDYVARDQDARLYILAAQSGTVEEVGWDSDGLGHYIRLVHDWNDSQYRTWYGHLASKPTLKFGDRVTVGQRIGEMGSTGYSDAKHLHLMLQGPGGVDDKYWNGQLDDVLDPTRYIVMTIPQPPVVTPPPVIVEPPVDDDDTTPLPPVHPPLELEFTTPEERVRVGQLFIEFGEALKAAPGRYVYVTVKDTKE